MTIKQIIIRVERSKKRISKERDKLRGLINDAQQLDYNCESAICNIERAADDLSELV